jgi:hypothetical protein
MRTKWAVLQERLVAANKVAYDLQQKMEGMKNTPFHNGAGRCSSCGAVLPTEAAFAKHFIIPDERFLNLGYCPVKKLREQGVYDGANDE